MPGWMFDPQVCAAMTEGPPRVELATLIELKRLMIAVRLSKASPTEAQIAQEERNEGSQNCDAAEIPPIEAAVG